MDLYGWIGRKEANGEVESDELAIEVQMRRTPNACPSL
jgi:hypothetical protein